MSKTNTATKGHNMGTIRIGQTFKVTRGAVSFFFTITNGWQCKHNSPEAMIAWQFSYPAGTFTVSRFS